MDVIGGKKEMFRKYSHLTKMAVITALTTLLVISCGGSGGGDGVSPRVLQPIAYTGNTTPVTVTLANAPTLVTNVLFGGSTASDIPTAVTITDTNTLPGEFSTRADRLMDIFHFSLDNIIGNATHGYQIPAALDVNETEYCESGYYTVQGALNDYTGAGTLTFDYYACLREGKTLDGMMYLHFHDIDYYYSDYYHINITMEFVLMTMISPEFNVSMSGTVNIDETGSGITSNLQWTMNYVEEDNTSSRMYKYENYVMIVFVDDSGHYPYSSGSITYTGTPVAIMYDSIEGSLAVHTESPLLFSSLSHKYADLGGQLVITGDNSGIQLSVESSRHAKLDLDIDVFAGYEVVRYVLWSELDNIAMLDLSDTTDNDGMHTSWEISFGLDPNIDDAADNLDNDGLTNLEEYQQGYDPSNPFSPTT